MIRFIVIALVLILSAGSLVANNVRIMGDVRYDVDDFGKGDNILNLKFTLSWDNSWRDDYNWDAVYICLKYRVKDDADYTWHHVYFNANGISVSNDYDYSVATGYALSAVRNTGLFVHRKYNGGGAATAEVVIPWNITANTKRTLVANDFMTSKVLISAVGIEMVYVPTGAFKLGDSESEKTFRRSYSPIPAEYDIVNSEYKIECVVDPESHPEWAADRINDNEKTNSSSWAPKQGTNIAWRIDFGENQSDKRAIRFFGVNGSKATGSGKPSDWALYGSDEKTIKNMNEPLWRGGPGDWVLADDSYPVEHAIEVKFPQAFRYYHIYIFGMQSGLPMAKTIGMTGQRVDKLADHSVLVDGPVINVDSLKGIGARDGENWVKAAPVVTNGNFPNGFLGFYTMKYEISQEQYVKFLNKLTRPQQTGLLAGLVLKKGNYIFGRSDRSTARNGIVMTDDQAGKPYIFSDSLEIAAGDDLSVDGETIAANFMSPNDMLAYADWVGLRPLSELEFEKISRRPFPVIPLGHEYAWNTTNIMPPTGITKPGTANETAAGGNANYGGVKAIGGPLRVGAFADGKTTQEAAGVSFYGAMDLSGNLAEMCFNFNTAGRKFNAFTDYSHGDGYLSAAGVTDIAATYWPNTTPDAYALKGGSYKDSDKFLAVSDRSRNTKYFQNSTVRDSMVGFRLGYSLKEARQSGLDVFLSLQNGRTSKQSNASDTICGYTTTYTIVGNKPAVQGAHTFIWYMQEDGGEWRILEGENDPNLTYSGFVNNLSRLKWYNFKRLMITPVYYATTAPVTVVIDQVADAQINTLVDTIDAFGNSQGGFYVASTIPSEFKWRWVYRGRAQTLYPYASGDQFSHYAPDIKQFKRQDAMINYGENLVQMERTTKGVGSCFTTVDLTVFIKEPGDPNTLAYSEKVKCGQYMKDRRDNQLYPTTVIGNQCWMGKNLNYSKDGSGSCFYNNTVNCDRFGRLYTWQQANKRVPSASKIKDVCPAGWHIPNNNEWRVLMNVVSDPAKKLKTSMYWQFVNMGLIGSNVYKYNAVPGGYYMPGYSSSGWCEMNASVRWWSTDYQTVQYRALVGSYYAYRCGNHTGGAYYRGFPPSYCGATAELFYSYETRYRYDAYYVDARYNLNTLTFGSRVDANYYNIDMMYVRCLKD